MMSRIGECWDECKKDIDPNDTSVPEESNE